VGFRSEVAEDAVVPAVRPAYAVVHPLKGSSSTRSGWFRSSVLACESFCAPNLDDVREIGSRWCGMRCHPVCCGWALQVGQGAEIRSALSISTHGASAVALVSSQVHHAW